METAGRAVVFSGITVAIGLLALIALPLPFLRSMGYGGMLIPLVSTLVAITLLPVILAKAGQRLDWPHRRTDDKASRAWTRWAAGRLTAALGRSRDRPGGDPRPGARGDEPAARRLRREHDRQEGRRRAGPEGAGERRDRRGLDPAPRDPGRRQHQSDDGRTRPERGRRASMARSRRAVPSGTATGPTSSRRSRFPTAAPARDTTRSTEVRDTAHAAGPDVRVGGGPAANQDFIDAVYGSFPLMIALIAITTFILLARASARCCCR